MTEKLYDLFPYKTDFTATVLSCKKAENGYSVLLDRTLFFPEEGGQCCDTGVLGGGRVSNVQIENSLIYHTVSMPLEENTSVEGQIDFAKRYRNMQNHTGEHIVSGVINRLFGLNNVGFHLGKEYVTVDYDGMLDRKQLDEVEDIANKAVYENVEVKAYYPDSLSGLSFRSKLDLTENVRLVEIPGYDLCACCAPHVAKTGEIGIIKLLDFAKYKSGVRVQLKCGTDALFDYREKYQNILKISNLLCVKQIEAFDGVNRIFTEKNDLSRQLNELKLALSLEKIKGVESKKSLCVFEDTDTKNLTRLVNALLEKCDDLCGGFSGDDTNGYRFVLLSKQTDLLSGKQEILSALKGNGGGDKNMLSGKCSATKNEIIKFFDGM